MKHTDRDVVDIVRAYTVDLISMITLAKQYHMTRQGIWKILKRVGIDTSKASNGRIAVSCTVCGQETTYNRARFKVTKHPFCGEQCYHAWLKHGNGNPLIMHRHSGRIARTIVSKYFALTDKMIVHHEDRNQYNNTLDNLRVFANQGDHIRYHRDFIVLILWDGSKHI